VTPWHIGSFAKTTRSLKTKVQFKLIEIKEQKFDVILIGDVLEHMVDPGKVLSELKKFLKPEGKFVISLPNVAHYSVRFGLLKGRWNMTNSGILDKTHLRFFTRVTAIELLTKAGLSIEVIRPSSGYIERRWKACFNLGKRILFWWPELLAVQFVFVAKLPR
jgi:2-polyprenyl-3-methyl-5-hydroxy-6-metoxy-1,4-benzoquinol methylase